ncbi:hypothetical protein MI353_03325 [Alteromonas sp. MCA-1]|nr:hypothetical protein [Alteromonas sp. MCA-1]
MARGNPVHGFKNKLVGTLSGAAAGGAIGFVAPQTSHVAGMAAAGMAASATGQELGSTATAAMEKGIENVTLDDVNVDATTTAAGTTAGTIVEGAIIGTSEKAAPVIKEKIEEKL